MSNLRRVYVPEDTFTVDEQLVDYRGTILDRTYIPSKPRKYGVKIFWLCEAKSGFPLNANIYVGKVSNGSPSKPRQRCCLGALPTIQWIGRDVVTDNFFTSHNLAVALLKVNLTFLGTIRCNRKEIPFELRDKKRQIESFKFAFDHENHVMLAFYIPQKKRMLFFLVPHILECRQFQKRQANPN